MEAVIEKIGIEKYSAYRDSGVDWLGEIPEHWELKPIRSIFEERNEKNIGPMTNYILSVTRDRGVIPYDEKGNVGNNKSEDIERYKVVYPNDLVINKMNVIIGSLGLSKYHGALSQVYIVLQPRTIEFSINYYSYIFSNESFYKSLIRYCTGIMELRESLSKEEFKKIRLPQPPTEEQTAIAAFLDHKLAQIDKAIGQKGKLIELMRERRQMLIHKAVTKGLDLTSKMKDSGVEWIGEMPEGWQIKKVKHSSQLFRGKFTHRPRNDERFYGGKYPFIQTGDISATSKYIESYTQTLNEKGYSVSKEFPKGTVVLTITGSNTGEIGILNFDACFPDSIVGFYPYEDVQFFYYSLLSLRNTLIQSSTISTQMNLNLESVGNQYISLPPLNVQKEISNYIIKLEEKFSDIVNRYQKEIEKLKEYKATLINSAVTGKIKVA